MDENKLQTIYKLFRKMDKDNIIRDMCVYYDKEGDKLDIFCLLPKLGFEKRKTFIKHMVVILRGLVGSAIESDVWSTTDVKQFHTDVTDILNYDYLSVYYKDDMEDQMLHEQEDRTAKLFKLFGKHFANRQVTLEDRIYDEDWVGWYVYEGMVVDIGRIDLTPKGSYGVEYWIVNAGYSREEDFGAKEKYTRDKQGQEAVQMVLERWVRKQLHKFGLPEDLPIKYFFRGWA